MPITSLSQLDLNKRYNYADYLSWQIQERVELIRGKVFKMSPAPGRRHQAVARNLTVTLTTSLAHHPCQVYPAPFDVRLPIEKGTSPYTVVQPDLCIVCNLELLDDRGCNGAPDLVVEILSPGNTHREMREKYEVYEEAGVREYWLVDPEHQAVSLYVRNETGKFIGLQPQTAGSNLTSTIFPDLKLDLTEVFVE